MYLKVHGDYILVGDILRSVTLLQYKLSGDNNTGSLSEVARDFNTNSMRAVEIIGDDEHFLGADDNGNIFSVKRQADAATDEERGKMEPQGGFHLGDSVNVFRKGSLNSQPAEQNTLNTSMTLETSSISSTSSSSSGGGKMSTTPLKSVHGGLAAVAGQGSVSILFGRYLLILFYFHIWFCFFILFSYLF